jgi:hypothetical protein
MSSRKKKGEGEILDQYPTPEWPVVRYLEAREKEFVQKLKMGKTEWCEPSCGEGSIVRTIRLWLLFTEAKVFPNFHLFEIDSKYAKAMEKLADANECTWQIGDFLQSGAPDKFFHVSIGNPPYLFAREFAEECIRTSEETSLLLRLNFFGSQKRDSFFREFGTPDVYILPNRPSFVGEGTDRTEYAWFNWNTMTGKRPGYIHRLALTPKDEIKAANGAKPAARVETEADKRAKVVKEVQEQLSSGGRDGRLRLK